MKRIFALCLALAVALCCLSAGAEGLTKTLTAADGRTVTVALTDADLSAPIAPEDNPWAGFDTSEAVHLVFYVVGTAGEDHQRVIDLVNQRMSQLINTTIEVPVIPLSDFATKYPLVLAGGTDCDIIMTHPYIGPFATQADAGAYYELSDEFLQTWMPETMKSQIPNSWNQARYKGKMYQIPRNDSDYENSYGVVVLKELREKYNIPEITNIDQFQDYLYAVAEGEKDSGIFAMYTNPTSPMTLTFLTGPNNWMTVGDFYWDADNEKLNADELFAGVYTDDYKEYALRMAEWAKHGVWPSNAITNVTHINDLFNDGKSASDITMYKSGNSDILAMAKKGQTAEYFNIMSENCYTRISPYNYDALAITSFCPKPERAALAIDVMKNDPIINNLLQGGIEGEHYILNEDGSHTEGPKADLYPWSGWAWCLRSQVNPITGGITPEVQAVRNWYDAHNITADKFPIDGFSFDKTGLEDIAASLNALSQEWSTSFDLGVFGDDTEAKLEEYRNLRKMAGEDELLEACREQLRTFLADK